MPPDGTSIYVAWRHQYLWHFRHWHGLGILHPLFGPIAARIFRCQYRGGGRAVRGIRHSGSFLRWRCGKVFATSATTTGFSRIDDRTLTVSVDVTRDNVEISSYCIITALNYGKAEVGRREFLIEPGGDRTKRFSVDIPTRDVAVAGTVYGCSDNPPSYLKPLSK